MRLYSLMPHPTVVHLVWMRKLVHFFLPHVVTGCVTLTKDAIPVPLTADAEEPRSVILRQVDAIHQLVYVKHHVASASL